MDSIWIDDQLIWNDNKAIEENGHATQHGSHSSQTMKAADMATEATHDRFGQAIENITKVELFPLQLCLEKVLNPALPFRFPAVTHAGIVRIFDV